MASVKKRLSHCLPVWLPIAHERLPCMPMNVIGMNLGCCMCDEIHCGEWCLWCQAFNCRLWFTLYSGTSCGLKSQSIDLGWIDFCSLRRVKSKRALWEQNICKSFYSESQTLTSPPFVCSKSKVQNIQVVIILMLTNNWQIKCELVLKYRVIYNFMLLHS